MPRRRVPLASQCPIRIGRKGGEQMQYTALTAAVAVLACGNMALQMPSKARMPTAR